MASDKFVVSFGAIILAMVLVCHMSSAAESKSASAVNGTVVSKPVVPVSATSVAPNVHANGTAAHLRVRRKGLGGGIGSSIAGGVASGAALTAIGGLFGGRV